MDSSLATCMMALFQCCSSVHIQGPQIAVEYWHSSMQDPINAPTIAPHLIACPCAGAKERYFQEKERLDHALAVLREGAEKVCILCYAACSQG